MIRLELLKNKSEWNEFVSASEHGTLFHTWEWISILEDIYKVKKLPIGIFEEDNLIGIFPTFIQKKAFLKLAMSPLHTAATPYGGPLLLKSLPRDIFEKFEDFVEKYDVGYIELFTSPGFYIKKVLERENYTCSDKKTLIIDLNKTKDELWRGLDKKCRNAIRKARKNNVEIINANDKKTLDDFYQMTKETYEKWGMKPPIAKEYFCRVWDVFKPKQQLMVLFAMYEGQLIAGAIFPFYKSEVYYWSGASYTEYNKVAPNNLIQWSLIEWAIDNKFEKYDMLGADIPSIAKFKASFGGEKVRHIYAYKFKSPLAKIGRKVYEKWKKGFV